MLEKKSSVSLHSCTSKVNIKEERDPFINYLNNKLPRSEMTIPSCFKICVNNNLDVQAVKYEESSLTYAELDKASNQLANYIRRKYQEQFKKPLEPGTPIAISYERGLDLAICILGVLKAGGAYVPIAMDYPEQRMQYILEDSRAPLLLTQSSLVAKFVNLTHQIGLETGIIDTEGESTHIQKESHNDLPLYSTPNDLAYIIYTSGSTGAPKGVLVEQRGVINLAMAETDLFNLQKGKNVLSFSHVSFDAFVWEFFGTLLSGATLSMAPQEKILPGEPLIQTLTSQKITHLTEPPSALYNTPFYPLTDLEVLVVAGEPCTKEIIEKWGNKNYRFFNAYGPTEATVCATIFEIDGQHSPSTIGKPLPHASIYILDEKLNPCPPGVQGELYIGGAGIARGYLNQEKLTEKSFILNPFLAEGDCADKQSNKLYRTGDIACFLEDGNIEFHGRKDYQVKVRGFRIELGEIQMALNRHKTIDQVIVDVYDSDNQKSLVAYIIFKSKEENQGQFKAELREYLAREVPAYMIPNYFMFLDHFPLSPSGKVDRKALCELFINQNQQIHDEKTFDLNESQKVLIEIWKSILKCGEIKVDDNFFDIGGHSLLMTQVILAIREKLGVNINIKDFLQASSLKELATRIDELKADKIQFSTQTSSQLPKIISDAKNYLEPFPLTDIQQAYWLGRHGDYDLSNVSTNIYREYKFKDIDLLALEKALNKVIQRQDMLKCLVINADHQQFLKTVPFYKIKTRDFRGLSRKKVVNELKKIREEMSHKVLPSDSWPIFDIRASLLDGSTLVHVCLDALILDAWSFYLFFQEWEIFYKNPDSQLPSLGLTFRDYVIAEQKIKNTSLYKEDREYWMKRIPSFPSGPDLPLAKFAHALTHQGTQCCRTYIEKTTWDKLKLISKDYKISPTGLLLSVFAEVLRTWSANQHFAINITLFNRLPIHEDVNKIIGDFTSIELLVVDHRSAGFPSYSSFLERATKLEAQLYEDLQHRLFSGV
jgi:amino acid adenylation domain-containing protein